MKILFLVSSLATGGAERVACLLASHWAGAGHEVTLMPTFNASSAGCAYPLSAGVRLCPIARQGGGRGGWPGKVVALRRYLQKQRFDVVCSFLTNVNMTALAAAIGTGTPVIVSERTFPPQLPLGPVLELLRRLLYPQAARVVLQTDEGLQWLRRAIPRASGTVIANPVVHPLPDAEPIVDPAIWLPAGRKTLLAVGRLAPEKQFPLLIESFGDISSRFAQWDLAIAGDGPERAALERLVAERHLEGRVKLVGRVGNLHAWYSHADAFAMTSRFEGFPNVLAEALSCGLPSLAVDCETGPRDLLSGGTGGVLVPRGGGREEVVAGLETLLGSGCERSDQVAAAIRERLAIETISQAWLSSFAEAIGKSPA